jgi:membrane protease subunit HflC
LQAYREGLNGKDTSFVLSPEGNFFRFFGGWAGEGAAGGTASGSAPRATR